MAPHAEAFLDGLDNRISSPKGSHHHTSPCAPCGFAYMTGCVLDHGKPPPRPAPIPCHPALTYYGYSPNTTRRHQPEGRNHHEAEVSTHRLGFAGPWSVRNIHPFIHSTTPVGLALGPDSPGDDERGPGTLGHPADGILTRLATHVCILTPTKSTARLPGRFAPRRTLSYPATMKIAAASSVGVLEPRYIVGAEPLDQ